MSAPRDYPEYLRDMLSEAQYAQQFLDGVTYDEFVENPEKQRAVFRCIEIVGEAARHIPDKIRKQYPQIEWRDITGMRDRLIHGYLGVNPLIVWSTVKDDFPRLQEQIEQILAEIDSAE